MIHLKALTEYVYILGAYLKPISRAKIREWSNYLIKPLFWFVFYWLLKIYSRIVIRIYCRRIVINNPEVLKMWGEYAEVCDYVPINTLAEANNMFAGFIPLN